MQKNRRQTRRSGESLMEKSNMFIGFDDLMGKRVCRPFDKKVFYITTIGFDPTLDRLSVCLIPKEIFKYKEIPMHPVVWHSELMINWEDFFDNYYISSMDDRSIPKTEISSETLRVNWDKIGKQFKNCFQDKI